MPPPDAWESRAESVMAGGDYALIKSVEGFEDFALFGRKQIAELGVASGDMVFAITEGGETSFVIGTAWQGVEVGPESILCITILMMFCGPTLSAAGRLSTIRALRKST